MVLRGENIAASKRDRPSRMERGKNEGRNMINTIVLTINDHKVKVTTDQEITETWKLEMIEWITNAENKLRN